VTDGMEAGQETEFQASQLDFRVELILESVDDAPARGIR
jgi:hypothetical protein